MEQQHPALQRLQQTIHGLGQGAGTDHIPVVNTVDHGTLTNAEGTAYQNVPGTGQHDPHIVYRYETDAQDMI